MVALIVKMGTSSAMAMMAMAPAIKVNMSGSTIRTRYGTGAQQATRK